MGLLLLIAILGLPSEVNAPKNLPFQELEGTLILIQGNSLVRSYPGALQNDLERQLWEVADKYPELTDKYPEELKRIIFCESSWRENVCSYKGCNAGMGLAQIIPSTLKYCEQKLGRKLDAFNSQDNLECAIWLYENEGTKHWESSRHCWDIDNFF